MVGVKENDQSSEQAMEDDWDDDCSMDGAFDESEYKRPPVATQHNGLSPMSREPLYLLGLCLDVRANGIVGLRL